ncbi:MAG: WecB/TagA/CpsF family glycosyltransferase [Candidatus Nanopelagicales bacterium]
MDSVINRGRHNVLGVMIDAVDYDYAVDQVVAAAEERRPLALTALAVHGVMTGVDDPAHEARLNSFDVTVPDGQPVRWALNSLYNTSLRDRVYGPDLTGYVLAELAHRGLPVFLYGSTPQTLNRLATTLPEKYPGLRIAGMRPSGFRVAEPGEAPDIAAEIRASGARCVLVGLGCPRQEVFAHALRAHLDLPLLAVGAAFDYHAGQLRTPPPWMQRYGLEWLWRLGLEPTRLWRRYLILNPRYATRLLGQRAGLWKPVPAPPERGAIERFPV